MNPKIPRLLALHVALTVIPVASAQPVLFVSTQSGTTVNRLTPPSGVVTYGTGLNNPRGMVFDGAGSLYVANVDMGTISQVPSGGGAAQPFASGFTGPVGLKIGPDGICFRKRFRDRLWISNGSTIWMSESRLQTRRWSKNNIVVAGNTNARGHVVEV